MSLNLPHAPPKAGFKGLIQNWRSDFLAAISVSLVALPLGLGVAVASGVPPISGVLSAIIGGIVVTLFRGSHLAINGPAAGLIAVILSAIISLDDGSGKTLNYVMAAICIAGALQVLMGLLKLGRIAELIPSSVIQGVMVAIGIIIFSSQMHVAMGTTSTATNTVGRLLDVFKQIPNINPFIFLISFLGVVLLVVIPKIKWRIFQFFPASLWVLLASIPFVYLFNFFEGHDISFLGKDYHVGPEYLINILGEGYKPLPNFWDNMFNIIAQIKAVLIYPDFSRANSAEFWVAVLSIWIIASIQTLAMAKAVDKLDPYKRKSDLNKDLIGVGLGTMVAGAIGGLPIITVIVRSTVNIHNNAKTKWSNFYHGLLLIVFLILLAPAIQKVPLAALAAILVYIGFKLASPKVFEQISALGFEQLLFMIATTIITLYTDLLWGMLGGTLLTFLVHALLARVPLKTFFKMAFNAKPEVEQQADGTYQIEVKGIANFMVVPKINRILENIPSGSQVNINMKEARLIGLTFMESIINFLKDQTNSGGKVTFSGLENHISTSSHNRALKILTTPIAQDLSPRQVALQNMADENGFNFTSKVDWNTSYLRNFHFFEIRPIERKENCITGQFKDTGIKWEMADVTFNEGAGLASEVFHSTVLVAFIPKDLPNFILEKEGLFDKIFDRIMAFSGYNDIDFQLYTNFSKKFLLMGDDEKAIKEFFNKDLVYFLEHDDVYHIESNGEALLIFKKLKLANSEKALNILKYSSNITKKILANRA